MRIALLTESARPYSRRGSGGLAAVGLCHVEGGGAAALPAPGAGRDVEPMPYAFARVRAGRPAARPVIHGEETAPGHRAHREAVAGRPGVAGAVEFAGRPASSARAWEGGTVVVFSALAPRGPRLPADAMLSGRAVVPTDVGVAREVAGPTGPLVPPRDPDAPAGACPALPRDEERRSRPGSAGRLRAQERFAVERVVGAFREICPEPVSRWPAFSAAGADGGAGERPRPFARPTGYRPAAAPGALAAPALWLALLALGRAGPHR
ncbi:glycosyltransferase [Kitasatospora sp. NPDC087315]|uniref:glycosyltransferase n=1 Tax=Kitasatospora sp. NPDC087315 TaxID=3364069 RepID=UPI003804E974